MRRFLKIYFVMGLMFFSYVMGWVNYYYGFFPYDYIHLALIEARKLSNDITYPGILPAEPDAKVVSGDGSVQDDGLIAYVGIANSSESELDWIVVDRKGNRIVQWAIDRQAMWKNSPKMDDLPNGYSYSFMLLDDGDLLLNFESQGVVRTNLCGEVKWQLPRRTHHSIVRDNEGHLWSPALVEHDTLDPAYPHYQPPYTEYTILNYTDKGEVLNEWSIFDLLIKHDMKGLLLLTAKNPMMNVTGDTLHVNKISIYTLDDQSGFFKRGDVMISLRNANTILVFDRTLKTLKFQFSGFTIRQHDPEFIDGNTISVFDNRNIYPLIGKGSSRILQIDAPSRVYREIFKGTKEHSFYSPILGYQDHLSNKDTLISESTSGRIIQIDEAGYKKWQYLHFTRPGELGYIYQSQLLAPKFNKKFFETLMHKCEHKPLPRKEY